jgi:pSer/pThr/pTyr-binding forkhead associated (FHA) protein
VLARSDVSRMHCRIDVEGDRLIVADLSSTNGTFINDQRIAAPTRLYAGDRLRVGSFILRYDTEAAAAERTQRGPAPDFAMPTENESGNSGT